MVVYYLFFGLLLYGYEFGLGLFCLEVGVVGKGDVGSIGNIFVIISCKNIVSVRGEIILKEG